MTDGLCKWGGQGRCYNTPLDQNRQQNKADPSKWYEMFGQCDKAVEQGLCFKQQNENQTQFNFTLDLNPLDQPRQVARDAQGNIVQAGMEPGYFCKWTWVKDEKKDLDWQLRVIRMHSEKTRERIYVQTYMGDEGEYRPIDRFTDG